MYTEGTNKGQTTNGPTAFQLNNWIGLGANAVKKCKLHNKATILLLSRKWGVESCKHFKNIFTIGGEDYKAFLID